MRGIRSRSGQVLLMVTFSLVAMTGMFALAVDLGWGQYLQRNAQKAADAAALAAAYRVFARDEYGLCTRILENATPSSPAGMSAPSCWSMVGIMSTVRIGAFGRGMLEATGTSMCSGTRLP